MSVETNFSPLHKKPKLTIALGAFNDSRFLPGALDSLLSQTFSDFELIISDNASTDETPQIIQLYAEKDSRIRVIRQLKNIGLVNNFNFLGKQTRGEYLLWAACDDRWSPEFLETIITGMEKNPSIVSGFTPYHYINDKGELIGKLRRFDYSGKTAIKRLIRFFTVYDDCMTYGIFRYSAIKDIEFPVWWWLNKNTPLNSAFAFLTFVLARGEFQLYGEEPLWFNCIKTGEHFQPFRQENKKLLFLLLFIVRKINLGIVQFHNIWHGSSSFLLAFLFIPVLILRAFLDIIKLISNVLSKMIASNRQSI